MLELISLLMICQIFGAIIGAGMAVWAEFAYARAMRDGNIDTAERVHVDAIAHGLRFGMVIILITSLGLVIEAFLTNAAAQPARIGEYWVLMVISCLVIGTSWALSRKLISFALGSAIVFAGWWFLLYLTLGSVNMHSFGAAIALYVVMAGVFYGILHYIRFLATRRAL